MKHLIILEGPDGGGKTTLGREISAALDTPITNHGPYPNEAQIWMHYFNSMLPAYSDQRAVILDRCWLAEPIYGQVFRNGLNRIEYWQKRILEYVASNCQTSIIWCLPNIERCVTTFRGRRGQEMLDSEQQLRDVHHLYVHTIGTPHKSMKCREYHYNYETSTAKEMIDELT